MDPSGNIVVKILGQTLTLKDEHFSPEEMLQIVSKVRNEVDKITQNQQNLNPVFVAVVAALNLSSELYTTKNNFTELQNTVAQKTQALVKMLDELALQ